MANYIYYNGELYHASGDKKFKYIAKVRKPNGKYRYFYTQEEYDAYKNGGESGETKKKSKTNSISKFFSNLFKSVKDVFKKSKKQISNTLDKGRNFVNKMLFGKPTSNNKKRVFKYVQRIRMSNGKYKYFYSLDAYERYLNRLKYQKNEPKFMKKVPKIAEDKDYTAAEDMAEVNEEYSRYDKDRSHNCVYCSVAYELRCRGYDVQAADQSAGLYYRGHDFNMLGFYKDPKMITLDENGDKHKSILNSTKHHKKFEYDSDTVKNSILKNSGKNSRGEIRVSWKSGGGHSMMYEVSDNGNIVIRDTQVNRTYKVSDIVDAVDQITITRTDNLELKEGILKVVEDN